MGRYEEGPYRGAIPLTSHGEQQVLKAKQMAETAMVATMQRDIPMQLDSLEAVVTAAHQMFTHLEQRLFTVCILDKPTDSLGGCGVAQSSENVATRLAMVRNRIEELLQRGSVLLDRLQV